MVRGHFFTKGIVCARIPVEFVSSKATWTAWCNLRLLFGVVRGVPRGIGHFAEGLPNGVLVGGLVGGSTAILLIGLLLLALYKRRKSSGLVLTQSNTDTSFDNLGFNGGRKISEYMDLTELELVQVRVTNTIKRKISAFTKEDLKTRRISCGRLELVEVPANSNIDSDILLTTWV